MKLTFLGTCSGTEPEAGYRHVSFTVETGGGVYFFDAGEGCAYTAHLAGIDLLAVRAIFISHTHADHVLGLPGLLWTMRKLTLVAKERAHKLTGRTVRVFIPEPESWKGVLGILKATEGGFAVDFGVRAEACGDGEIFSDAHLRVEALHNSHLGCPPAGAPWRSFSFRIEAEGKAIVYSGDTGGVEELVGLIAGGCDLLLMETGHHRVADVCAFLRDARLRIGQVAFIHHGRAVLTDPQREAQNGRDALGRDVIITRDGMTMSL